MTRRIHRREIFDGRIVRLSVDRVELPNGHAIDLELIRHPGAAAVVPLLDDGTVLLVRQYRYASGGWLLEVPAGKLDGTEDPAICARREVEEETGHRPGRLVPMGRIWTTPGFTDEAVARAASGEITDAKSICALLRAPRFAAADPDNP